MYQADAGGEHVQQFADAVRALFEARNRAWINGHTSALAATGGEDRADWYRRFVRDVRVKRREMSYRKQHLLRAHTRVHARDLNSSADGREMLANVEEHITWVYLADGDYLVESRVIAHTQRWTQQGAAWVLQDEQASDERDVEGNASPHVPAHAPERPEWWFEQHAACTAYDRVRTLRHAELWWNGHHPAYVRQDTGGASFVSQCLAAGNVRMTGGQNRQTGWWYRHGTEQAPDTWSVSWGQAHALLQYLLHRHGAEAVSTARELRIGDLVFYNWDGAGRFSHAAVVCEFDGHGDPLVNAHAAASYHRHYLYLDSQAWSERTRYAYLRVFDEIC